MVGGAVLLAVTLLPATLALLGRSLDLPKWLAKRLAWYHAPAAWDDNLYMGWLGTLRELSKPTTDVKYPEALRTSAWAMKTTATPLAVGSALASTLANFLRP